MFAHAAAQPSVDPAELAAVNDAMAARGPDGQGIWFSQDKKVGLAHRRLSIIDLSDAAAQPMTLDDGRLVISYNGEIYNFMALRRELEARGRVFHTRSDTEVLLHLYDAFGPEMVKKLRGMFAFAIWDDRRRGLFLARDPFGIKPLYYAAGNGVFRAASQVKALLAGGGIGPAPDPAGHAGFFLFGYVPDPHTLYADIRALPAGSRLWIDGRGPAEPQKYFDVTEILADGGANAAPPGPRLGVLLRDAIAHHQVADVPVGVFLSAGRDSATIAALAAEADARLETVTLAFDEFRGTANDEAPLAEKVAGLIGADQRTVRISGADFHREKKRLFAAMDQPTIDGVNTYFVARAARRAGLKVALSGLGGDELFGGYDTFTQVPRMVRMLGAVPGLGCFGRGVRAATAPFFRLPGIAKALSPKWAGVLELGGGWGGAYMLRRGIFMPWELAGLLGPEMAAAGLEALQPLVRLDETAGPPAAAEAKMSALEISWYMKNQLLRDSDWAGMAHGLEIRVPLVDETLFRRLAPAIANGRGPSKAAMAATPASPLPDGVLNRPKTGFQVPVREWMLGGDENAGAEAGERGFRGWAKTVYRAQWKDGLP